MRNQTKICPELNMTCRQLLFYSIRRSSFFIGSGWILKTKRFCLKSYSFSLVYSELKELLLFDDGLFGYIVQVNGVLSLSLSCVYIDVFYEKKNNLETIRIEIKRWRTTKIIILTIISNIYDEQIEKASSREDSIDDHDWPSLDH